MTPPLAIRTERAALRAFATPLRRGCAPAFSRQVAKGANGRGFPYFGHSAEPEGAYAIRGDKQLDITSSPAHYIAASTGVGGRATTFAWSRKLGAAGGAQGVPLRPAKGRLKVIDHIAFSLKSEP